MSKELIISDEHRTNPLSLKPGGYTVKVIYTNGKTYVYDKIKDPARYISRIPAEGISEVWVDGEIFARTPPEDDQLPW
jgi:hypothetical protein